MIHPFCTGILVKDTALSRDVLRDTSLDDSQVYLMYTSNVGANDNACFHSFYLAATNQF